MLSSRHLGSRCHTRQKSPKRQEIESKRENGLGSSGRVDQGWVFRFFFTIARRHNRLLPTSPVGCYETYDQTLTGLSPEIVYWKADSSVNTKPPVTFSPSSPFSSPRSEPEAELSPTSPKFVLDYHRSWSSDYSSFSTFSRFANASIPSSPPEQDFEIHALDGHNLLRPETVESIFVLYRLTGKQEYRDMGWEIFKAFEKYTRVKSGGYTSLVSLSRIIIFFSRQGTIYSFHGRVQP